MAKQVQAGNLEVDPALIMATADNVRFGLKETRIESMMKSILDLGGVMNPLHVTKLEPPENGFEYRLNQGHYRHAAALRLNTEQNAGIEVPIQVDPPESELDRMKRQLAENNERENLTPMDKAKAIKELLDAGVSKIEVRSIFSMPGGRKGLKNQPASNSFINMHLSFLDLSKSIQDKIHDGRIGVSGAYQLVKASPDKRAEIVQSIEDDRLEAIASEEKDEEKLLDQERKLTEAKDKREVAEKELADKEAEAKQAAADAEAKKVEAKRAHELHLSSKGDEKKAALEKFRAADRDAAAAIKKAEAVEKERVKTQLSTDKVREATQKALSKLEAAQAAKAKAAPAAAKPISDKDVKKKVNVPPASQVALKLSELHKVFEDEGKAKANSDKIKRIFWLMGELAAGVKTTKQVIKALMTEITGELEAKK
jgi:ParB/RepB/Spo0J family partition protein